MTDKPEKKYGSTMLDRWKYDHDTDWLGSAVTPPPPCPACASPSVIPIVRGEPTTEADDAANRGEAVIGGCVVSDDSTLWYCKACTHEFGRLGGLDEETDDG